MKQVSKATLVALSIAIFALAGLSSCKTNGGYHDMGSPKAKYPMRDEDMPNRR